MIDEIIQKIESVEFSVLLGIASSYRLFRKILYDREEMKALLKLLRESSENRWIVFTRVAKLAQSEIDLEYENPWDTALVAYLEALSLTDLELAKTAANPVLLAKNCWWAEKFARYLVQHETGKESQKSFKFPIDERKDYSRNNFPNQLIETKNIAKTVKNVATKRSITKFPVNFA
jgi:hypothetical protein